METPEFTGDDLAKAFDAGAEARFTDMVENVVELMKYDDVYECFKFLHYYGVEQNLDLTKLNKILKEFNYEL